MRSTFLYTLILSFFVSLPTQAEVGRVIASAKKNAEIKQQKEQLKRLPKRTKKAKKLLVKKKQTKPKSTRLGFTGSDIPAVLSKNDVILYKKMFRLQRQRQRSQVASYIPKLKNRELMGHLIAERLLHPNTKSPYKDLKKWMSRYSDHSMAPQVYGLAKKRKPKADYGLKKPKYVKASVAKYSDPDNKKKAPQVKKSRKRTALLRKLKHYRKKQFYSKAILVLSKKSNRKLLGDDTWAGVTLKLARSIFNYGDFKRPEKFRI